MPYSDELDTLLALELALRLRIAERIATEAGVPLVGEASEDQLAAVDEIIEAWREQGEEENDLRAFRSLTPLQELLAEHEEIVARIIDTRDRRLS